MNLTCKNGKTISNSKPKCKVYFINLKYKAKQGKVNALSASLRVPLPALLRASRLAPRSAVATLGLEH